VADLFSFVPLFADQDETTILARWREWANEGLDPGADPERWTDVREGGHWWTMTTPGRREAARLYDVMGSEVLAAAFPQYAWGEYLDDHAELRGINRLPATFATGRALFTGDAGTVVPAGTVIAAVPQVENGPDAEYITTESVTLDGAGEGTAAFQAREAGEGGNVPAGIVTDIVTPIAELTGVTNEDPVTGGTDPETDDALRPRVLETFQGTAVANAAYYRRIGLNFPGIGRVSVRRAPSGPGTVFVIISTADGDPVSSLTLDAFQELLDPDAGSGGGLGQAGAIVTVQTAATMAITAGAVLELDPGFSIDGETGTVAVRGAIQDAVASYVDTVESGGEVVYSQVVARVVRVTGVHDATVTLNGGTSNVPVPISPPQVPSLVLPMTLSL